VVLLTPLLLFIPRGEPYVCSIIEPRNIIVSTLLFLFDSYPLLCLIFIAFFFLGVLAISAFHPRLHIASRGQIVKNLVVVIVY